MDRKDFDQLLSRNQIPSLLLFEGDEEYMKQSALAALRKKLLPEGLEDLNESLLEAPETDLLISAAETLPFMADRRLVVVRDHPALIGRAEADERLTSYLASVPPTTVLLFYCTKKPDGRKKLYTAIKKQNGIVTFSPMKDRELTLMTEITKIASHSGTDSPVHPDEIRALATPSAECTVFQMVDAVVSGQNDRAFRLMRNQLLLGTDRLYMLSMLLRQFRLLQHIRIMQYEKCSRDTIRSTLGVPPFAVDQYMRQASCYTNTQIKKAVSICFDTEYAVKSGRMNQEGSLESVMLKLLNLRA